VAGSSHLGVDLAQHLGAHRLHHRVASGAWGEVLLDGYYLRLQHIHILRIIEVVKHDIRLSLANAACGEEVLYLVKVEAHLLDLLQELLLLFHKEARDLASLHA